METQKVEDDPRPVAPFMPKPRNRTEADNRRWQVYRKEVRAWNLRHFPRETFEQRKVRETTARAEEFRAAVRELTRDPNYYRLETDHKGRVDGLIGAVLPTTNSAIEVWIAEANAVLGTLRGRLKEFRPPATPPRQTLSRTREDYW